MAVTAEPEQQQLQLDALEQSVVLVGGNCGIELATHAMHRRRGHCEPVEERLLREAVVRALVVGRDATLVAPPESDLAPVGLEPCGVLIGVADRRAAGEHDRAASARLRGNQFGDRRNGIVDNVEIRPLRHLARV